MGVGWIDNIYNNSNTDWFLKSIDDRHNGALAKVGGGQFTLDDQNFHKLEANSHYRADWCGIPWYFRGDHYKVFSPDKTKGTLFYTSEKGGKNWIIYEELNTGRIIARQGVPLGSDFHCNLRFENDGIFIDVVNNNAFSGENAMYQILNEAKEWTQALAPIIAAAIQAGGE